MRKKTPGWKIVLHHATKPKERLDISVVDWKKNLPGHQVWNRSHTTGLQRGTMIGTCDMWCQERL